MLSVTIKSNMLSIVMLPVIMLDVVTPIYLLRSNPENISPVHTEKISTLFAFSQGMSPSLLHNYENVFLFL